MRYCSSVASISWSLLRLSSSSPLSWSCVRSLNKKIEPVSCHQQNDAVPQRQDCALGLDTVCSHDSLPCRISYMVPRLPRKMLWSLLLCIVAARSVTQLWYPAMFLIIQTREDLRVIEFFQQGRESISRLQRQRSEVDVAAVSYFARAAIYRGLSS